MPRPLFKRPTNVYNFHDTVMALVVFHAEQVTKLGAHSLSTNHDDFEDIAQVDRLATKIHQESKKHKLQGEAMKLEEGASKRKRKKEEASDFLDPPPASLLKVRPSSSATRSLGDLHKSNKPTTASAKVHNNPHNSGVINIDEDEVGKENI